MKPKTALDHEPLIDRPIDIDESGMEFSSSRQHTLHPKWNAALADRTGWFNRVLEVGSNEGRTANVFLQMLPNSHITCIDRFEIEERARRFDRNLARYGNRVRKICGFSHDVLSTLVFEAQAFEVVYIAGSHKRGDVYIDSLLCWEMLVPGGMIIWDDYEWRPELPDAERPHNAINRFLARYGEELIVLHNKLQVIAKRRTPTIR